MKMLIAGNKVDSSNGKTIDVTSPVNGEFLDTIPAATADDVNSALEYAKIGFEKWSATSLEEREVVFRRFGELIKANMRELCLLLTREYGKDSYSARREINDVGELFNGYLETVKRLTGDILNSGNTDLEMVIYEPIGTVLVITPFNSPLHTLGYKAGAALASGNVVIVKPASDVPLALIRCCELLLEAGVPGEALQVITGNGSEIGDLLTSDPRIAAVAMTGSTEVGLRIASKSFGKFLTPNVLELGGNDAFIVMDDGDVDAAVRAGFYTRGYAQTGQICVAPKRFLIHKSIVGEFTDKIATLAKNAKCGFSSNIETSVDRMLQGEPPQPEDLLIGPLISEKAAKTVEEQINRTIAQGARLIQGGKRNGAFFEPSVLVGVTRDMDVAKDMEIFGPVIPIIEIESLEEAIEIANSSCYGLNAGIFTKDWKVGLHAARKIESGTVVVNGTGCSRAPRHPFGGIKLSGTGKEGLATVGEMVRKKLIILKDFN